MMKHYVYEEVRENQVRDEDHSHERFPADR